jgi:hypothetical protein
MYNPETSVTLDTQDTGRRQTNENKSNPETSVTLDTQDTGRRQTNENKSK